MPDPRAGYRLDPKKVSKSKESSFSNCAYQYKLEHIDGVETPTTEEALLGTIGHQILEMLSSFCSKPTPADIQKAAPYVPEQAPGHAEARDKAASILIDSIDMIDFSHAIAVEKVLEIALPGGYFLDGTLDRIDLVKEPTRRLRVVDYKFGRWVPKEDLDDDSQACFYLTLVKEHAASLLGISRAEAELIPISFERCWVALGYVQGPVFWSEEIDKKARARAVTHARAVEAEKEWRPTCGAHCKRCPFVGSCPEVTAELKRREKFLPVEAISMDVQELYKARQLAKETADIWKARDEALDLQIRAVLDLAGPIQIGPKAVDFKTSSGWRKWDNADPKKVAEVIHKVAGKAPPLDEITHVGTDGDKVKFFMKGLPKHIRDQVDVALDVVAPKQIRQSIKESEVA